MVVPVVIPVVDEGWATPRIWSSSAITERLPWMRRWTYGHCARRRSGGACG
jgi:hypothetical protein